VERAEGSPIVRIESDGGFYHKKVFGMYSVGGKGGGAGKGINEE